MTGEAGTGKTLIIHQTIARLGATTQSVFFRNSRFSFAELISFACQELDLSESEEYVSKKLTAESKVFKNYLAKQSHQDCSLTFFMDDAHDIAEDILADLLTFLDLQTTRGYLLQIVLIGLPKLEMTLRSASLLSLTHNGFPLYRLTPLPIEQVGDYINQRFSVSEDKRAGLFSAEALTRIASLSRGIPRLINVLCDLAVFTAQLNKRDKITAHTIIEAAKFCSLILGANMVRGLDIEIIAPQHGAIFKGKDLVNRFIEWCAGLHCGVDLVADLFKAPSV